MEKNKVISKRNTWEYHNYTTRRIIIIDKKTNEVIEVTKLDSST